MAEAQDGRDRTAKWLRRIARVVAVVWASMWTYNLVATVRVDMVGLSFDQWMRALSSNGRITIAVLSIIPWACVAVAWRWEAIGGLMLLPAGLLTSLCGWEKVRFSLPGFLWALAAGRDTLQYNPYQFLSRFTPGPAPISGALFLASWWVSRRLEALKPLSNSAAERDKP